MQHLRSGLVAVAVGIVVWLAVSLPMGEPTWSVVNTAGILAVLAAAAAYLLMAVLKRRRAQRSESDGDRRPPGDM